MHLRQPGPAESFGKALDAVGVPTLGAVCLAATAVLVWSGFHLFAAVPTLLLGAALFVAEFRDTTFRRRATLLLSARHLEVRVRRRRWRLDLTTVRRLRYGPDSTLTAETDGHAFKVWLDESPEIAAWIGGLLEESARSARESAGAATEIPVRLKRLQE